jgi:hypothetical protein
MRIVVVNCGKCCSNRHSHTLFHLDQFAQVCKTFRHASKLQLLIYTCKYRCLSVPNSLDLIQLHVWDMHRIVDRNLICPIDCRNMHRVFCNMHRNWLKSPSFCTKFSRFRRVTSIRIIYKTFTFSVDSYSFNSITTTPTFLLICTAYTGRNAADHIFKSIFSTRKCRRATKQCS